MHLANSSFTVYITKMAEMPSQNYEQPSEILDFQAHIWNHLFSFINPMSLKCAIQLRIPDIINRHGAPMLLSELVKALPINKDRSDSVYRLMRLLVHSGYFKKQSLSKPGGEDEQEEGYVLAPVTKLLLKDDPLTLRPFLLIVLDRVFMDPFHLMSEWFQNDDLTPLYTTHGKAFWDLANQDPKLNHIFNEGMSSDARFATTIILKHGRNVFEGLNSIVDVGGGTGTAAKAIAEAFPKLRCICFDLPHVVNGLDGNNNLSYVGGNMFEAIPKADALLLKSILHDWSDEECVKILKRCKEAIPSKKNGGKIIIIDIVVNGNIEDKKLLETQLFFDLFMMSSVTGRERSEKEWAKLFFDGGFSGYKITPILRIRSFIEVYP